MANETMARRASIIHGYGASPDGHWFGWLAERLEAQGVPTSVPALPRPQEPDPVRWAEAVRAELGTPHEGSVIVAHSLGCLTVLRYLRSLSKPWRVGDLVLVSGFAERLHTLPGLDAYIGDGCDVEGIGERVDRLTVIRSDEDPYVPVGYTDRLARLLGTSARVVPGAGHFLASDGVTSPREILDAVTSR